MHSNSKVFLSSNGDFEHQLVMTIRVRPMAVSGLLRPAHLLPDVLLHPPLEWFSLPPRQLWGGSVLMENFRSQFHLKRGRDSEKKSFKAW